MRLITEHVKPDTFLPRIMKAALALFVEKGIDGTTIKDIAKRAKVSEGALYRHFAGKDELAWHLFSTHLTAFTAHLDETVFAHEAAEERVRAFVSECFKAFDEHQDLFTFLILSEHRELKKFRDRGPHPGHLVLRIIREGQRAGEIAPGDPYVLGSLLLGGIIRVCVVRIYEGITKSLHACEREVSDRLWRMLAP
ncbi:MAG TPA: TetR/AcrR family transcriptional regulator [Nitrospiria bacterium]|nr:TetR/AcrR family transcriptional regulator [Nitrospiria bacterium]